MNKLLYIKNTKEKHLLSLGIYGGEETARYTLDEAFISQMGYRVGDEVDADDLLKIKRRDAYIRGKRKALSILSFADNSILSLKQKLLRYGIPRDVSEEIILEMQALGYINEDSQISRMVERLANESLFGPKKIMARLVSRGYSPSDIRTAMREMSDSGKVDFSENKRRLIEKHGIVGDTEEENKLLYKNGY